MKQRSQQPKANPERGIVLLGLFTMIMVMGIMSGAAVQEWSIVEKREREAQLILEVDGATHGSEEEIACDIRRTEFLQAQGWRVLRVWNEDVTHRIEAVLETVLNALDSR